LSLQEAINAFPIVAWCQENLQAVRVGSDEINANCQFCGGYRKLNVNIAKRLFHCFKCREGGHGGRKWNGGANLFQFMVLSGLSKAQAYKEIFARAGFPDNPTPERKVLTRSPIPDGAIPLNRLPDHEPAVQYLRRRQVPHLIPVSYVATTGRFKDRVILPCNYLGEVLGTECKAFKNQRVKALFYPEDEFHTSETVYTCLNWDLNSKTAVVTESILDAETFQNVNSIGLYGCRLHEKQVSAILALGVERLIWCLDGDAYFKPYSGTVNAISRLTLEVFDNWVCTMGYREDPNELGPNGCDALLKTAKQITSIWDLYAYGLT